MNFYEALDACRNADELVDTDPIALYRAAEIMASRVDWLLTLVSKEEYLQRSEILCLLEGRLR